MYITQQTLFITATSKFQTTTKPHFSKTSLLYRKEESPLKQEV
jgi:hypothetical protein